MALSQACVWKEPGLLVQREKEIAAGVDTHVQIVGEDHGGGAIAKGGPLGELPPFITELGHVHSTLLQGFPDGGHFLEQDPAPG